MTERRKFTTRERIGVITESGFSAEGLALSGSPRAMRALEELISVLCDTVLGQREQIARVRELADRVARYHGDGLPRIKPRDIYRALDGER